MKQRYLLTILTLLFAAHTIAQNQEKLNPFAKYGLNVEVGTITDGMYEESHDLENIVEIGSILFDVRNRKILGEVPPDTLPKIPAQITSLWLQVDPLASRYYHISPYAFCANNPIKYIDPDGRDWYSYLDKNGNTQYQYTTEYRSQKDLDKAEVKGTYLGITHKTEDTYYSLLNERFDLTNTDGSLSISAQVAEKLDNAIINYYKGPIKGDAYGDDTRYTDMTIPGLKPGREYSFDYKSGEVTYFASENDTKGFMYWGNGKVQPLHGYFVNKGAAINTYVRKREDRRWNIVYWRFKDETIYKAVREQLKTIFTNRY